MNYAAKTIIDNMDDSDFVCKSIAKDLCISEVYLGNLFKKEYGMPPGQFMLKTRMEEAKNLLTKNFNVTQTAQMVGYKDIFQFSKAYKKFYGQSPKSARNKK